MKSTRQFSAALSELARVPSQIAPKVAKRIKADIILSFRAGVDPYGKGWAPLKPATLAKGRHPPPLSDTLAGRNSIKVRPSSGSGIAITVGKDYMGIHQNGDPPRMVARRFLPVGVLPANWRTIWQQELSKAVKAKLK